MPRTSKPRADRQLEQADRALARARNQREREQQQKPAALPSDITIPMVYARAKAMTTPEQLEALAGAIVLHVENVESPGLARRWLDAANKIDEDARDLRRSQLREQAPKGKQWSIPVVDDITAWADDVLSDAKLKLWLLREPQAKNAEARAYLTAFVEHAVNEEREQILVHALKGEDYLAGNGWNVVAHVERRELTADDVFPEPDVEQQLKRRGHMWTDTGNRARQAPSADGKEGRHRVADVRGVGKDSELDYTKWSQRRRAKVFGPDCPPVKVGLRGGLQPAQTDGIEIPLKETNQVLPFERHKGPAKKRAKKKPAPKAEGARMAQPMTDKEARLSGGATAVDRRLRLRS